ncbi:MAG: DUF2341 domain-containing protein, partial [Planctomycetota bacterium]
MNKKERKITILSVVILITILSLPINSVAGPFSQGWQFRKQITIDHNKVDSDLTNFPVLISLTTDANLAIKAQSSGNDILFTDNADNKIPHEIELFNDSTGQLVAWVKVANLSSSVDTVLYMYYGNAGAADQRDTVNVWNSNYLMVQHLQETTGIHYDSTANNNDGTAQGGLDQNATGKINGADDFNGSDNKITFGSSVLPNSGSFTASAWIKADDLSSDRSIISTRSGGMGSGTAKGMDLWYLPASTPSELSARIYDSDGVTSTGTFSPNASISSGTWYYITAVYDGSNIGIYVNENFAGENAGPYNGSGASNLGIGYWFNNTKYFDGIIEEVRISNTERLADWVSAEYRNQSSPSAFYSVGSEELNPLTNIPPYIIDITPEDGENDVDIALTQLTFTIEDAEGDSMDYNVTTSPTIGSASDTSVGDGTYVVAVSNLQYDTTYSWTIDVNDGNDITSGTYSFTTIAQPGAWYDTDWPYRRQIVIDDDNIADDLTDFPLLVSVIDSNIANHAQPDGDDIMFVDNSGVKLAHETERYENTSGELVAWVKVPFISSTSDTIIWVYYGNPSASNQQDPTNVWDSSYVMVHHLNEIAGTHYDSTTNAYNAGINGDPDQNVPGKIGIADQFDGAGDYLSINSFNRSSDTQGTVEVWANMDTLLGDVAFFQYFADASNRCKLLYDLSHTQRMRFNLKDEGAWEIIIDGDSVINTDQWYHVAIVQNSTTSKLYVNAVQQSYTDSGEWFDNLGAGTVYMGTSTVDGVTFPAFLDGLLDEIRVSNVARSAAWIEAEYLNQNNPAAFYTIGDQVSKDAPVISSPVPAHGAQNVSVHLSELSFTISDPNGDLMDYSVTTTPNIGLDSNTAVPDGTYTVAVASLQQSQTYNWTVEVTDGNYIAVKVFSFTTEATLPVISNPTPANGALNVDLAPTLSADINDPQDEPLDWQIWTDATGAWAMVADGTVSNPPASIAATDANISQYNTLYNWKVIASDGNNVTEEVYSFTTRGRAPVISNPDPCDGAIDVITSPMLSVDVNDPDADLMDILFQIEAQLDVEDVCNSEPYLQGWNKSPDNPLELYNGSMATAPKNTLNSPVVIPIEGLPYKDYDWVFMFLDTNSITRENFLHIKFATNENFLKDIWTDELHLYGGMTEPFDAIIIDGKVYMWGFVDSNGDFSQQKVSVTTSTDWENWTAPEVTFDTELPWKSVRTRGFTIKKVPNEDKYLAFFAGQSGSTFSIGRATATLEQLINNDWQEDPSNPVLTGADISWDYNFAIGIAYSEDEGVSWNEYRPGNNPVVEMGAAGSWDSGYVSTPYVIEMGTRSYKMYYGARPDTHAVYNALGVAYMGQTTGYEYGDVVIDRQIAWQNLYLTNVSIDNASIYEDDLSEELLQDGAVSAYLNCEIVTPVIDLGDGHLLAGGTAGTRIFAQNITGTTIEIRGSNTAPTVDPNVEFRQGHLWYSDWGTTIPDSYIVKSYSPGDKDDEYYIDDGEDYRYVQMRITNTDSAEQFILDQIVFSSIGLWEDIDTHLSVGDGTYSVTADSATEYEKQYLWRVLASDDFNTVEQIYSFTTIPENYVPAITDPYPEDGNTAIPVELDQLFFTLYDEQGDLMDYNVTTDPNIGTGTGFAVGNGTYIVDVNNIEEGQSYTWTIQVTDGNYINSKTYSFTVEYNKVIISNISPEDDALDVPIKPTLQAYLYDQQGDSIEWEILSDATGSWQLVDSGVIPDGNGLASTVDNNMSDTETVYNWIIRAADAGTGIWVEEQQGLTTAGLFSVKWNKVIGAQHRRGSACAGDLNNDGLLEVVVGFMGGVRAYDPIDGSTIWTYYDGDIHSGGTMIEIADLNNDGIPEVICPLSDIGGNSGIVAIHGDTGTLYWKRRDLGGALNDYDPLIFDIDGYGYPTIFTASKLDPNPGLWALNYDGTTRAVAHDTWKPCWGGIALMDYDSDGRHEIYLTDWNQYTGKGHVWSYFADDLTLRWQTSAGAINAEHPQLIDVTGDGIRDVVIYPGQCYPDQTSIYVISAADGSTIRSKSPDGYICACLVPTIYDIDNDGNPEVIGVTMDSDRDHVSAAGPKRHMAVHDLITFSRDAYIPLTYGNSDQPRVGNVWGDEDFEIVVPDGYSSLKVYDGDYNLIEDIYLDSTCTLRHPKIADIDNDGYNEIIITTGGSPCSGSASEVWAIDTMGVAADPPPRVEVQNYSEYRLGAAEYVEGPQIPVHHPIITAVEPPNGLTNVPIDISQLTFWLLDQQGDTMDYFVTTTPYIGSDSAVAVSNGPYTVAVSGLDYDTTYSWQIDVNDGNNLTSETFIFTTAPEPLGWYNDDWRYRKQIIIDHSMTDVDLTDYVMLIDITDADLASKAQPDGNDILFTDIYGNKLSHEIEKYQIASPANLIAWVNVPFISSSSDTILYMYYGNPSAPDQQDPLNVWDDDYVMVQHLNETTGTHYDSTAYANHAYPNDVNQAAVGIFDGGDYFDGIDDNVYAPTSPSLDTTGSITVEAWVSSENVPDDNRRIVAKDRTGVPGKYLLWGDGSGNLCFQVASSTSWFKAVGSALGSSGEWMYIVGIYDADEKRVKLYRDGVLEADVAGPASLNANTENVSIGASHDNDHNWHGAIDEVRISKVARDISRLKTSHNNYNNPQIYMTVSNEQLANVPLITDETPEDDTVDVSVTLPELSFRLTDPDGDLMDYTVTTSPDIGSDSVLGVGNGVYTLALGPMDFNNVYNWTVEVNDGIYLATSTFTFTTERDVPYILNESPLDGSLNVSLNPTLSADIYDNQGDPVQWQIWTNASGVWAMIADGNIPSGDGT